MAKCCHDNLHAQVRRSLHTGSGPLTQASLGAGRIDSRHNH